MDDKKTMTPNMTEVRPLDGFKLWIKFSDGRYGILSLENELNGEIFQTLNVTTLNVKI